VKFRPHNPWAFLNMSKIYSTNITSLNLIIYI
jgi:hypothetical protein